MSSVGVVADLEFKPGARLSADEDLWSGTRRSARPTRPRLEARGAAGGTPVVVDLIRSSTA